MTSAAAATKQLARDLREAPARIARAGAQEIEKGIDTQLARDVGGDRRLSGLRTSTLSVEITEGKSDAVVEASGSFAAWRMLEDGTRAHTVKPRKARALHIAGVGWRAGSVKVRGMRPKHTYSRGVEAATQRALDAQAAEWSKLYGA